MRSKRQIKDANDYPTITIFNASPNTNILSKNYFIALEYPPPFNHGYKYYMVNAWNYYFTVDGDYLGSFGAHTGTSVDYMKYITTAFGTVEAALPSFLKKVLKDTLKISSLGLGLADPTAMISSTFPPPSGNTYTVAPGDSWESIAEKTKGDPSWADALKAANNYNLDPEQIIQIPQFIPTHNNAQTHAVYNNFVNLILGSLYPHMDTPAPDTSPSFFDEVFHVVVQVVTAAIAYIAGVQLGPIAAAVAAALTGCYRSRVSHWIRIAIEIFVERDRGGRAH